MGLSPSTATAVMAGPVRGLGSGRPSLSLASSAPPRSVRGMVQTGPRGADETVEQALQFGHGQRDELAGSGCGAPILAVARVALGRRAPVNRPGASGDSRP